VSFEPFGWDCRWMIGYWCFPLNCWSCFAGVVRCSVAVSVVAQVALGCSRWDSRTGRHKDRRQRRRGKAAGILGY